MFSLKPPSKSFKFKSLLGLSILFFATILCFFLFSQSLDSKSSDTTSETALREKYSDFLINHPFRKSMQLSDEERLAKRLPPNKYFEQEWLYTSDPVLLRPAPERVYALQEKIKTDPSLRTPPGDPTNLWEERGPDNVGGRTRSLIFLPGSTTKVLAGGVSGGLWLNNDITNVSTVWQRVNGVPTNLAVMSITVDPNNTDIMYLGTGEVYTWGAVNGNGIYKSTDGGANWINIYSGGSSPQDKLTYVQKIIAWNNPTTNQTEIFFGADAMAYTEEVISNSGGAGWNWLGANTIGLYKSTDGVNFSRLTGSLYESSAGNYFAPNDFDIAADGTLWMGTKYSYYTGEGGGRVFKNTGTGWTNVRNLGTNGRVQIACSKQTANKIYVLAEDNVNTTNPAKIYRTTNGFSSAPTLMAYPNDADTGISANDFTRGQSFYDLMIGVDPSNDATVYVGGIDLFKSTNSGSSWNQFSHWYGGFGYQEVHADQHAIAFAPGMSNRVVFGNDGGIFYSNNGGSTTSVRNNGYNVTQFYKAAINQQTSTDKLLAGAQDNGSQLINGAPAGIGSSVEKSGGDGCYAFIDQDNQYMIMSYVYNSYYRHNYTTGNWEKDIANNTNDGDFVNQCTLDSNANILYANGTTTTPTYQIYRYSNITGTSSRTTLSNAMLNTYPTAFVASPYTSNRILVGTALGKIIRLSNANGSPTWTDISMPGQVGAVSDIRYGASENNIMVTFHNYGVVSIWYTSNGGTSWVSKEGDLPDMPVKCILQNPSNTDEVIVGTELGVWKTSNWTASSPNWTQSQNGMSDVKVTSFDYRSADGTIIASTFGRGMFTGKFNGCGPTTEYVSGSWSNGTPTSSKAVIIKDDYNTAVSGNIDACSLIVESGKTLTVGAGNYIEVQGNIVVDGNLFIDHEGSLVQIDDDATVTKNGNITVRKITPYLEPRYFMVMGSPMSAESRTGVYGNAIQVRHHLTANFNPDPAVAAFDPLAENFADEEGDNWLFHTGVVNAGEGYLVLPQATLLDSGSYTLDYTLGTLNNGEIDFNVLYNGTQNASPNIVGNPYASAIDANLFMVDPDNSMIDAVYFWEHLTAASSSYPGYKAKNYDMGDISMFNGSGGIPAANDGPGGTTEPNGYISSGQGFGFKATAAGTAKFKNYMRITDNNNTYRRPAAPKDRIWLNVSNETYGLNSTMLISFSEESLDGYDAKFDAKRLATPVSLYSKLDSGEELAIQGRSAFNTDQEVTLGFVSQIEENQEFKISISNQDGIVWPDVQVYLVDKAENVIHNLTDSDYIFKSKEGAHNERFVLLFKRTVLGTSENQLQNISLIPNPTTGYITIISPKVVVNSVEVFDIRGRKLMSADYNTDRYSFDISSLQSATYFIKIYTQEGILTKRIIKN